MAITTLIIDYNGLIMDPQDHFLMRLVADEWDLAPYKYGLPERWEKQPPPDLIVSCHNNLIHLGDIKQKWGYNPFLLFITGEPRSSLVNLADWSISYEPDSSNNYCCPNFVGMALFMAMICENQDATKGVWPHLKNLPPLSKYSKIIKNFRNTNKSRFCNFIYSNYYRKFPGTIKRADFCQLLMKYKKVDCAGGVMQNTDELKRMDANNPNDNLYKDTRPIKSKYISKYKFTIAFENQSYPNYVTEKIWGAFLAGSVPIYWGCPQIAQIFNPAAFINCHDYSSLDEVVSRVQEIDNDHELYLKYATASPFLPDSLICNFTPDKIQVELNQIMRKVVKYKELYNNSISYSYLRKETKFQLLSHYIQRNIKGLLIKINFGVSKIKGIVKQMLIILRAPKRFWSK